MNTGDPAVLARLVRAGLVAAVVAGVAIGALDLAAPLQRRLADAGFAFLRGHAAPVSDGIVVVGIDEATVASLPEPMTLWHRHLGAFLAAAAQARARVVGVDLVLPDRSHAAIAPDLDRALVDGILRMRQAGGVVLALTVDEGGRPRAVHPVFVGAAGPQGAGFALWRADPDGTVRVFDERLGAGGEAIPTFVGQLARALGVEPVAGRINYALGTGFDVLPLATVLQWVRDGDERTLAAALGGKVVLVGSVLPFSDRTRVPVPLVRGGAADGDESGVLVHAQALRTLLAGRTVQPLPAWVAALLAGLAGFAWLGGRRPAAALATVLGGAAVVFGAGLWALSRDVLAPVAAVVVTLTLAAGARLALEATVAWRERIRLRGVFSGYVSPQVMAEIEAGRLEGLANAHRFICVLVMDVRGFTTRAEREPPDRVLALLNELCEQATEAIHGRGGTVDKFMGDGILAFFGAPAPMDDACGAAFGAAIDILERVRRIGDTSPAAAGTPLAVGVGLACGEATVGHVGAATRHSYTAIGDCVNVASRLESLTKEVGVPLVMTKDVAARIGERAGLVPLGVHAIKGHTSLEVVGWR